MVSVSKDMQLRKLPLAAKERVDNFPEIVSGICGQVMNGAETLDEVTAAHAVEHGISRFKHGYRADLIVTESRLLQREISHFLQRNLLAIDLSTLISDVMSIADLISAATEEAIRSFNARSQAA